MSNYFSCNLTPELQHDILQRPFMSSQLESTTQSLREKILAGAYANDEKLRELALAEDLGVSRTVIRLALGEIEKEGLVYRQINRGFRVQSFTLDEVIDAIAIRGELEGMAARLCAERGLSQSQVVNMQRIVYEMDDLLGPGMKDVRTRAHWIELNGEFHEAIIQYSANLLISENIRWLSRIPLVSAKALVFDQSDHENCLHRVNTSHQDHKFVLNAIVQRQGSRANSGMREHAIKSGENKRLSFDAMNRSGQQIPGLALVKP